MNNSAISDQWSCPRRISVVVDNPSWVLPFAETLVKLITDGGDEAHLCRSHDEIENGAVAFYLGCVKISPPDVLARNAANLIVHASDLPKGRGFSPMTWLTIEGVRSIPVCLLEAVGEADAGAVVYRDWIEFEGYELLDEMQMALGGKQVELCQRFLNETTPPKAEEQTGEASVFGRRGPKDSELNVEQTIADQFDLLRTVDNDKYPAFFNHRGHRYKLAISKMSEDDGE
ncbi:MAG: hypothetical protein KAI73_04785 [Rhodospirillaceae bacterium]|nr:hypothetical protein [Rhodospirillaceae bacterium]